MQRHLVNFAKLQKGWDARKMLLDIQQHWYFKNGMKRFVTSALMPNYNPIRNVKYIERRGWRKLTKGKLIPEIENYLNEKLIGKPSNPKMRKMFWFRNKHKNYAPNFAGDLRPKVKLRGKAISEEQLPPPELPEIAFIGRSNVGKSSLFNALCGREGFASVGWRPGTTKELYFYDVGSPPTLRIVDVPGFGEADAKEEKRLQWTEFSLYYLKTRKPLKRVLVLIDAIPGLHAADLDLLAFLDRKRILWQIIVTKADTLNTTLLAKRIFLVREEVSHINHCGGPILPVSSKLRQGLVELRRTLDNLRLPSKVVREKLTKRMNDDLRTVRMAKEMRKDQIRCKKEKEAEREEEAKVQSLSNSLKTWGLSPSIFNQSTSFEIDQTSIQIIRQKIYDQDPLWRLLDHIMFPRVQKFQNLGSLTPALNQILGTSESQPDKGIEQTKAPELFASEKLLNGIVEFDLKESALPSSVKKNEEGTLTKEEEVEPTDEEIVEEEKKYLKERYKLSSIESLDEPVVKLAEVATPPAKGKRNTFKNEIAPDPSNYDGRYEAELHSSHMKLTEIRLEDLEKGSNLFGSPTLPRNVIQKKLKERSDNNVGELQRPEHIGLVNRRYIPPKGKLRRVLLGKPSHRLPQQRPPKDIGNYFNLHESIKESKKLLTWEKAKRKWNLWASKHPKEGKEVGKQTKESVTSRFMEDAIRRVAKSDKKFESYREDHPILLDTSSNKPRRLNYKKVMRQKSGVELQDPLNEGIRDSVVRFNYGSDL